MKFFHLSDLHIGKQLHHYNLREDQRAILREVVRYAEELRPEAVIIAGDLYDKTVPSAEAVSLFDEFLTQLSQLEPAIPILIISGNHDSAERLEFASNILSRHQIYLAGSLPAEEERLMKVTFTDAYGEVDVYLLPFLKPSHVRHLFPDQPPSSYTDAVQCILEREAMDAVNRRNVLVSHQFYTGNTSPETCDSEVCSVGGIDNVDISAVEQFDYVALGHLHGPQSVGVPWIRYCGTLLKYSVSESEHRKSLTVVTLAEKGAEPRVECYPLHPIREVRRKKGTLQEILDTALPEEREDYISVTLTDEVDPFRPKEQLSRVYRNILEVRVDNTRTRNKLGEWEEELTMKDPMEAFEDFYREMQGRPMGEEERNVMRKIYARAAEEVEGR